MAQTPVPSDPLFARVKAGDQDAIADFVIKYHDPLRRYFRRRWFGERHPLRRDFDSEDFIDSFFGDFLARLAADRAIPDEFPSEGRTLAWLRVCVLRRFIDKVRRAERKPPHAETDDTLCFVADAARDPDQLMHLKEIESLLAPEERRIYALLWDGHNFREVAEALGEKYGTVYMRWQRAVERVRQILADQSEAGGER